MPDGYRPHSGGSCPLGADVKIGIVLRGHGAMIVGRHQHRAGSLRWWHDGGCGDIIGFRLA